MEGQHEAPDLPIPLQLPATPPLHPSLATKPFVFRFNKQIRSSTSQLFECRYLSHKRSLARMPGAAEMTHGVQGRSKPAAGDPLRDACMRLPPYPRLVMLRVVLLQSSLVPLSQTRSPPRPASRVLGTAWCRDASGSRDVTKQESVTLVVDEEMQAC